MGPKNAEIAVLEQLEPKIFFATQSWWVAIQDPEDYKNVRLIKCSLFSSLQNLPQKPMTNVTHQKKHLHKT